MPHAYRHSTWVGKPAATRADRSIAALEPPPRLDVARELHDVRVGESSVFHQSRDLYVKRREVPRRRRRNLPGDAWTVGARAAGASREEGAAGVRRVRRQWRGSDNRRAVAVGPAVDQIRFREKPGIRGAQFTPPGVEGVHRVVLGGRVDRVMIRIPRRPLRRVMPAADDRRDGEWRIVPSDIELDGVVCLCASGVLQARGLGWRRPSNPGHRVELHVNHLDLQLHAGPDQLPQPAALPTSPGRSSLKPVPRDRVGILQSEPGDAGAFRQHADFAVANGGGRQVQLKEDLRRPAAAQGLWRGNNHLDRGELRQVAPHVVAGFDAGKAVATVDGAADFAEPVCAAMVVRR